jgi:hypothetical protein
MSIALPANIGGGVQFQAGAGNDRVTLKGGGGALSLDAGTGNDTITLVGGGQTVVGGDGIDTLVVAGNRADYTLSRDGFPTLKHKTDAAVQFTGVERIAYADVTLALDTDGVAGQAYRLYKAAFGRAPDADGLGFWISKMDQGTSLNAVAAAFAQSAEFKQAYASDLSHTELITGFYHNILGRAPDAAGLRYWVDTLDQKIASMPEVLAYISGSEENFKATASLVGQGVVFEAWGA